jgi:hypothetical protein
MQTDEFIELLRKLGGESQTRGTSEPLLRGWRDAGAIANDMRKLASADPAGVTEHVSDPPRPSGPSSAGESTASTVLKTIGMVTGAGPLVTGLIKLFGSGAGAPSEPPPLTTYTLPERMSVEAGLTADRSFVPLSYSQSGAARPTAGRAEATAPATQIHVNVQAMDSRSFLDHSDDIARAVRDAMLRSHSLNDVVSEL